MSKLFSTILFLTLIAFFSTNAFAQATTGTVEGTVTDQQGAVIPGATVTIENSATGFKKSIVTDQNGYFIIAEIPTGSYKITAFLKGFETSIVPDITVSASSRPLKVSIILRLASEEIIACELTSGEVDHEEILVEKLPRKTTFGSVLKFSPKTRPEFLSGGVQIDGASGSENVFLIDGQEVTNFRTGQLNSNFDLPFEIIQEVRVVNEKEGVTDYTNSSGGIITVNTRGGNNQWRGNFGASFTPNNLQGSPNVVINRFGTNAGQIEFFQPAKDGGSGFFPTASFGGPIVKDYFWFFASYSPQIYRTTRTVDYFSSSNPANRTIRETIQYESNVRTEQAFVRLDAQPTSSVRMFGTFLYNPIVQDGALPSFGEGFAGVPQSALGLRGADYLATRGGRQNSNLVNGQITWNPTNYSVINFRAGRTFLNEKLDSYGIPRITRFICGIGSINIPAGAGCAAGFQNIANNSVRDYDASVRTTFDADAVFIIDALGRHNFKFGYQYNRLFNEVSEGYVNTGIVQLFYGRSIDTLGIPVTPTAGNLGSGFLQRFGTVGEAKSTNQALFAQDSWTIKNRLTLNLGIRFEDETLPDYNAEINQKFGWGDKISPRIGFVFDVLGDGKNKIFGSFGWFYDRLKFESLRSLQTPQIFFRDYFEILPSRGANYANYTLQNILGNNVDNALGNCPIINSTGYSVCQFSLLLPTNIGPAEFFPYPTIDPDLKPQRTTAFTIGFEREIIRNWVFTASYVHRRLDRAVEDIGNFNSQGSEVYFFGNPGFGLACEVSQGTNFPCAKAERRYDAFEVIIDKRGSEYFFNANYTYSRLYGNYSGLTSSDEFGRISPNITRYFDLPPYGFNASGNPDNGRLATDRPHVFKAYGGYTFRWNTRNQTTASAFTTIQSGTPLTTVYSLYNLQTSILNGRGDLGRTEIFTETDLLVSHRLKFGKNERFSFEPFAIFLNLFNEQNELSRQTSISATNFTSTTLTQGGCTTCTSEAAVFNTIFNGGGIRQFVQNYLNTRGVSATGIRNDYNLPNLFQSPRYFRFGMHFLF